jgi:hypothetical protein
MNCRLCNSPRSAKLCSDDTRSYFHCEKCGLIFVPARDHVSFTAEKERYDLHDNSTENIGYVNFLGEMVTAVGERCGKSGSLLDYGSGKNSVLTRLLKDRGYDCIAYDPLYGIGIGALAESYDAIILCEVIEHLRSLKREIRRLKKTMKREGSLIVRTQLYPSLKDFPCWWYKNDITHVNFFCRKALDVCAGILGKTEVVEKGGDIFIFSGSTRPRTPATSRVSND